MCLMIVFQNINDVTGAPLVVPESSDEFCEWLARFHEKFYPVGCVCVAQLSVMGIDFYILFL